MAGQNNFKISIESKDFHQVLSQGINAVSHPIKTTVSMIHPKANVALNVINSAKDFLVTTTVTTLRRNSSLGENYKAQTEVSNIASKINLAKGGLGALRDGALSGLGVSSLFGKVAGVVVGVAASGVALASYVLNQINSRNERMSYIYDALNSTNAQTTFSAGRAGLYDNGRGTEN